MTERDSATAKNYRCLVRRADSSQIVSSSSFRGGRKIKPVFRLTPGRLFHSLLSCYQSFNRDPEEFASANSGGERGSASNLFTGRHSRIRARRRDLPTRLGCCCQAEVGRPLCVAVKRKNPACYHAQHVQIAGRFSEGLSGTISRKTCRSYTEKLRGRFFAGCVKLRFYFSPAP